MTAVQEKIGRVLPRIRLEARVIAVVLLADAALHLYWITGARPRTRRRSRMPCWGSSCRSHHPFWCRSW
jgi:hypothetical protein